MNKLVRNRFEGLCRLLEKTQGIWTSDYTNTPPVRIFRRSEMPRPVAANTLTVGMRYAEQAVSNSLYGAI